MLDTVTVTGTLTLFVLVPVSSTRRVPVYVPTACKAGIATLRVTAVLELAAMVAGVVPLTKPVNVPAVPLNAISLYVRETLAVPEFVKVNVPIAVVPIPCVPKSTDAWVMLSAALALTIITKNKAKLMSNNLFILTLQNHPWFIYFRVVTCSSF